MADREDSPDWLRAFQAPTRSITTLSSDSEALGDTNPERDYSLEEDEKSSIVKSYSKKTPNKRVRVGDEIPAKRRKTEKDKEGGSKDDHDVKREESFEKPLNTSDKSVWALSSDSESDSNAAIREEANENSSFHELSDSLRKQDIHDEEEAPAKVAKKGKSPKKQLKLEQVKPKAKKKPTSLLIKEDSALRENEANEISPTHELSELMKKEEKDNLNKDSTSKVARKRKTPKKRPEMEDVEPAGENQAQELLEIEGEVGDVVEERLPEKHNESRVSSSTLSLILPEKVSRSKALVECEGESIDLSGDMGAVGRVIFPETPSGEPEMFLDLKGVCKKQSAIILWYAWWLM
ncbi:hypothetical protein RND81_05G050500 [Saponaria officinalis]|uniref:Uncharacterized protein n=1 Tax=Saponaria officinalis TaxID=3572 RepID=A0AAW1KQE8_SAPOF